jgi:murein L,D-transpeptidase YafK
MEVNNRRRSLLSNTISVLIGTSFSSVTLSSPIYASGRFTQQANLIVVWKSKRKMSLFRNKSLIKTYNIRLGFSPIGHKKKEGDGKTPEGRYFISHHNPNSSYHLSLGINYPNKKDISEARKNSVDPGGDIFIHGGPKNLLTHLFKDWTGGCIAVHDHEIEEIYRLVPDGTVIYIYS